MAIDVETLGPAPIDPAATQAMVPMRDGVPLATDVYLPAGPGPFPAVLVRLPYDKNGRYCFMPFIARHVVARGYAFVPQDVRGKFRSGGEPLAFVNEVPDAYDSIEWITRQPWSNGDVGMWGDSYYGFTQWAAVAAQHPALKAIVPRVTIADIDGWLEGVTPLYGAHYLAEFWTDAATNEWAVDWSHRPLAEVFDEAFAAIGRRSASFDYVLARSRGAARTPLFPPGSHPFEVLRIPTLHGVGWFDNITPPHMLDYEALVRNPATAPFQYLHAGSTDHENYQLEHVPIPASADHDAHDDALERMLPGYIGPALDFFDAFLSGRSDAAAVPRVRWHLAGPGWQQSPAWPPPGAAELRLYLGGAERAGDDADGGSLLSEPGEPAIAEWTHDPADPVPSTIVNPFALLYEYPDERSVEARPDVLTFTAPAVSEPLTLAGRVVARLDVASDAPSLFLHVKLVDVHPGGRAHALLFGQIVHQPGSGATAEVYLGHTGYRLAPGHRLRLHVAASDFPLFLPHPGSADNPWDATTTRTNRQRLATGGTAPSYVSLTVLPAGSPDPAPATPARH
ncbi:MAG TPA: CocE/NonD family hydrolase [Gaiellales bacterium]